MAKVKKLKKVPPAPQKTKKFATPTKRVEEPLKKRKMSAPVEAKKRGRPAGKSNITPTKATAKGKTAKKKKNDVLRVITPVGMISFPKLAAPDSTGQYADDKYKLDLLFDKASWKEDPDAKAFRRAVLQVGREFFNDQDLTLADFPNPFKQGSTKENKDYADKIYITPKSTFAPTIIGPNKKEWNEDRIKKIKGGDFARLVVSVFPYSQSGGGVTCGLEVVQFAAEGESLGGGRAASVALLDEMETELGDLDEEEGEEEEVKPKAKKAKRHEEEEDDEDADDDEGEEESEDEEEDDDSDEEEESDEDREEEEEDPEDADDSEDEDDDDLKI